MAIKFKGIDLESDLERIIPHMATAEEYGGVLQNLQSVWDNLSLLGQLSGAGTDMSGTRRAFGELAGSLLNQLGREALKKCLQETASKAQVAINILVRNLFERTADIGFLSSDEDIRAFLRNARESTDQHDALAALRSQFGEYVRKYSVYSDIILLDPEGNVLARLDDQVATTASADPLIRTAIETKAAYVESFRESDLFPGRKQSLIYAFRVTDADGSVLGVLCLCFRFENESELIFSDLVGDDDWTVVTILDDAGIVIASSDPIHIPLGARLTAVLDAEYRIVKFGAMEYIATSRAAQPYQGYGGPGWLGHVMVPITHAFNKDASQMLASIEPEVLDRIIHASTLFAEEIRDIPSKAALIQRELNRSVWNGNVSQQASSEAGTATFSKILLKEISVTGARTKDVFEGSIADLHETVVTSLLRDNQFHAALAIDIMDRNLYERANDCRWWALASDFIDILSRVRRFDKDAQTIGSILRTINGLYTVYTDLIVFDGDGEIVAASSAARSELAGTTLTEEWVARILALRDAQGYVVSSFVPSPLYEGRSTYIYGAAIRAPERQQAVGGVAIVFDSEPQFAAMLKDALPRDGAGAIKHGAFGLFVEPNGRVIACSDEHFRAGDMLSIDDSFLRIAAGRRPFRDHGSRRRPLCRRRERFSGLSGVQGCPGRLPQRCDRARLFTTLRRRGACRQRAGSTPVDPLGPDADRRQGRCWREGRPGDLSRGPALVCRAHRRDRRGDRRRRYHAAAVHAARHDGVSHVSRIALAGARPSAGSGAAGQFVEAADAWVARSSGQIVVMTPSSGVRFGVLVDDLGEIVEVLASRLTPLPAMVATRHVFADSALAPNNADEGDLVVVLRADLLYESLSALSPIAELSAA